MKILLMTAAVAALLAAPAVGSAQTEPGLKHAARAQAPHYMEDQALVDSIAGSWRPAGDVARDKYRHPLESLTFWGLQPGMTVADLQPGGGYWTQILAPYALKTHGTYIAGIQDFANPKLSERSKKARMAFEAKFGDKAIYGPIVFRRLSGPDSALFAPAGTVDLVLTSRELHNWAPAGKLDKIMGDAFAALKPGAHPGGGGSPRRSRPRGAQVEERLYRHPNGEGRGGQGWLQVRGGIGGERQSGGH